MMRGLVLMLAGATTLLSQGEKIRVIAFGAHPDDCDIRSAGTAGYSDHSGQFVGRRLFHFAERPRARVLRIPLWRIVAVGLLELLSDYRICERLCV